jgi:hypothetical protein
VLLQATTWLLERNHISTRVLLGGATKLNRAEADILTTATATAATTHFDPLEPKPQRRAFRTKTKLADIGFDSLAGYQRYVLSFSGSFSWMRLCARMCACALELLGEFKCSAAVNMTQL